MTYRYYGYRLPRQHRAFRDRWTARVVQLTDRYVHDHGTPDVLHAHSALFGGYVTTKMSRRLQVPSVLTEHSSAYLRGTLTALQTECALRAFSGADAVITVSSRLKQALHEITDRRDIQVVPNTVDTKRFSPNSLARVGTTFRFACIAVLRQNKNVQLLIRAFSRAFCHDAPVALEIVGDGSERRRLERLVRSLAECHRITFHGAADTDGVASVLGRSHCCVSSSDVETFGVTLIEAIASGIPVVATRSGGPQDIVTPECGYLVPVGDEAALASTLLTVFLKRRFWADRSTLLSEYAQRSYGNAAIVSSLNAVYRSL